MLHDISFIKDFINSGSLELFWSTGKRMFVITIKVVNNLPFNKNESILQYWQIYT